MPIPSEYDTSNPVVRDVLNSAEFPVPVYMGEFVAPDFPIDFETVDAVSSAEHSLDLDDLRAADAEAKSIRFEAGAVVSISVVERGQKSRIDMRKIADANKRGALIGGGTNILAERAAWHRRDVYDAKEYRRAALVSAAANFAAGHKDVTGLNFRTADLIDLADTWKAAILADAGFDPEFAWIGKTAWRHARRNAAFREFAGGSDAAAGAGDLTLTAFADFLGLKEVRKGDFSRKLGNSATVTQFWPVDSFQMFINQKTLSDRTFAATAVVPYGPEFSPTNPLVDVRTEAIPGVERLTEVAAFHRYRASIRNATAAFLVTGIVGA